MAVILLYLPLYAVLWVHSLCTQSARGHRAEAATRARHRHAGTIGVCLILGIAALWYGSILVMASLPRMPPQESLADYAERRAAAMTLEDLRRRYSTQALP